MRSHAALRPLAFLCLIGISAVAIDGLASRTSEVDEALVIGARAIVRGTVTAVASRADRQDRVFTYTKLRVEAVLKGSLGGEELVLKEEGGETKTIGERVFGTPRFEVGERVIVYLDAWPDGTPRVYQMCLGKLTISSDPNTGKLSVTRDVIDAEGLMLTSEEATAQASRSPVDLDEYEGSVRRAAVATSGRSRRFAARHYQDVAMLARPPEYADADPSSDFEPSFAILPIPARWFQPDSGQPVLFYINPSSAPNPQAVEDVAAAIEAWRAVPATSVQLVNGGAAEVCSGVPGIVAVSFNNCDGRFEPEPDCARIIARGGIVWDNRVTKQVNGQTYRKALRGFISLNPYSACSYDDHCNLREVVTHELGHSLGLGHSQNPDATMYGTIHFDGRCASLKTDDARALAFIYPLADTGPKPLEITTTMMSDGIVGNHFVQVFDADGGSMPYTWSWVPGPDRVPDGMRVDVSGALVGTALEAGTFTFDVEVGDAEGTIAVKRFTMTVYPSSSEYVSQFVSQSVPTLLQAGQQFNAVLRWRNTGSRPWDASTGFKVASQYPSNTTTWGPSAIVPAGVPVQPGDELEARFAVTAPSTPGAYNFQWQLFQNGVGIFGQPSVALTMFVYSSLPPSIDGPATLEATVGSFFSNQLTVTGGAPPFTWSVSGGALPQGLSFAPTGLLSLPPGLSLNSSTGLISGVPTAAGNFEFTVRVTDANSRSASKPLSIAVSESALQIAAAGPIQAARGAPLTVQLAATGGFPPYAWSVVSGALPDGVSLDPASGLVSGVPNVAGTFQASISVRDQKLQTAVSSLQVVVSEANAPAITRVKYKAAKRKLIVTADRLDGQAALVVDAVTVSARFDAGTLISKKLTLLSGQHSIQVVNPGGVASPTFILTVQ